MNSGTNDIQKDVIIKDSNLTKSAIYWEEKDPMKEFILEIKKIADSKTIASEPIASEPIASEPIAFKPITSEPITSEHIFTKTFELMMEDHTIELIDIPFNKFTFEGILSCIFTTLDFFKEREIEKVEYFILDCCYRIRKTTSVHTLNEVLKKSKRITKIIFYSQKN